MKAEPKLKTETEIETVKETAKPEAKLEPEPEAKALAKSLPISTKQSVEICTFIRGKTTDRARKLLEQVLEQKIAVPHKRYNQNTGHKRGKIAAGRYPLKAVSEILKALKTAEANAAVKDLPSPFKIKEIIANQASRNWHFGRHRRRKTKRTHIQILLQPLKKPTLKKKTEKKSQEKKPQQTQKEKKRN